MPRSTSPASSRPSGACSRRWPIRNGAGGLADDVAVVPSRPGHDLVLTKDAIVEGVHFLPTDPLDTVAKKLMRVNLSDLAAKGAEPFGYLLACHWSERCGWPERMTFVDGLRADQKAFGIALLGGDTVATPGPASFSMTLLGWTPKGRAVGRAGARAGDLVFVTGAIGDGWLGLEAMQDRLSLDPERIAALSDHYRTPMPRTEFALPIRDMATASIDVSDGLIADLAHLAEAGGSVSRSTSRPCRSRPPARPGSTAGSTSRPRWRNWSRAATTTRSPLPPRRAMRPPCGGRRSGATCA
jgi:thiamin-phosphate kinase